MEDWKGFGSKARKLLKSNEFAEARKQVSAGLQLFPNQVDLIVVAIDSCCALGEYEQALDYANQLIRCHPQIWRGYGSAAQHLAALTRFEEAQNKIIEGLDRNPDHPKLLAIASDVFRASGKTKKSLKYAKHLIACHPRHWSGYARAAQDLIALRRFEKAKNQIIDGLERIPNHFHLLMIAIEAFRASGHREQSLEYAKLLITYHPQRWQGYGRAAQDLAFLKHFEKAQDQIIEGLRKMPNHLVLLAIANDIFRASGDRKTALEFANGMMTHHPDDWNGYCRTAQDLTVLNRFDDLERFGLWMQGQPLQPHFVESVNDWMHTAKLGLMALHDLDRDATLLQLREFSGGRNVLIPVGDFCLGAQLVSDSGGRTCSLPFDWLFVDPSQIKMIIQSGFNDFLDPAKLSSHYPERRCGHTVYGPTNFFNHHDPSREPDRSALIRRIARFNELISKENADLLFFNVRVEEKTEDLLDLLEVFPEQSKILSFVFLGNGDHARPVVHRLGDNVLQIIFRCDNHKTAFAKKGLHPSGYTDGSSIHCPYSRTYAGSLLRHVLSGSQP